MAYDSDKAHEVCAKIAEGMSARSACREVGIKTPTFLLWCDERTELAERYARARVMGADNDFEKLGELQDEQPPKDDAGKIDSAWVAWRRLQVDTMKWALAKKAPKYSDRYLLSAEIQHEHSFKSVSDSAAWIGQLIGSGQESAPTEHLPD